MGVLKVITVGNSVGVILPKEILERLRVGKGGFESESNLTYSFLTGVRTWTATTF